MFIEIKKDCINLGIIEEGLDPNGFRQETVLESYVIEKGQELNPSLYGLPHRYPGELSDAIRRLKQQALESPNGIRKFAFATAKNLEAILVATEQSTEL